MIEFGGENEKMNKQEVNKIRQQADKFKRQLIKKANKKGLYENFGQKEVRQLTDLIGSNLYSGPQEIRNILFNFDNWCMNYTG